MNLKVPIISSPSGEEPTLKYRSCRGFRWRDDLARMPSEWVGDTETMQSKATPDKYSIKCRGLACQDRRKTRPGNKSCSNGHLCKDCCYRAQRDGSPECAYSTHNASFAKVQMQQVSSQIVYAQSTEPQTGANAGDVQLYKSERRPCTIATPNPFCLDYDISLPHQRESKRLTIPHIECLAYFSAVTKEVC